MFNNCKTCLFYDSYRDKMEQQLYDDDTDGEFISPPHFCIWFNNGIPNDVWNRKTKCIHCVTKK